MSCYSSCGPSLSLFLFSAFLMAVARCFHRVARQEGGDLLLFIPLTFRPVAFFFFFSRILFLLGPSSVCVFVRLYSRGYGCDTLWTQKSPGLFMTYVHSFYGRRGLKVGRRLLLVYIFIKENKERERDVCKEVGMNWLERTGFIFYQIAMTRAFLLDRCSIQTGHSNLAAFFVCWLPCVTSEMCRHVTAAGR